MFDFMLIVLLTLGSTNDYHVGERVEQDGIIITVEVSANVYTITVMNVDAPPITRFEMYQKSCYNQRLPLGWQWTYEDDYLTAWTDKPSQAIFPGHQDIITTRVSSTGAVLGVVPVTLGFDNAAPSVEFKQVWGPVHKPRSLVVIVASIVGGLALLHTIFLVKRSRQRQALVND